LGLGSAMATSKSWANAAVAGGALAFRPLANAVATPAPGDLPSAPSRQAEVARQRRGATSGADWRTLAQVAAKPTSLPSSWSGVDAKGNCHLSHRHSMAVCGGPTDGARELAVLFGGNISRTVAGHWQTSSDLTLAELPCSLDGEIELQAIPRQSGQLWPPGRWGATLTALQGGYHLWGGWSCERDGSGLWVLRLREAGAEWQKAKLEGANPPAAAFHTATPLDDGKRMAVIGGLGEQGSNRGVWMYHADSGSWSHTSDDGPSCAGHAAGAVDQELAVFGGVERAWSAFMCEDDFRGVTSLFDIRMERWHAPRALQRATTAPSARRNPLHATVGRHIIISGGWDDTQARCLNDTWALDVGSRAWTQLRCNAAPRLEGHKAVVSGFEIFGFGGHNGPSQYPSHLMSMQKLSLGVAPRMDGQRFGGSSMMDLDLQSDEDDDDDDCEYSDGLEVGSLDDSDDAA